MKKRLVLLGVCATIFTNGFVNDKIEAMINSKVVFDENLQSTSRGINYERLKMFSVMTVDEDGNDVEVKSVDEIKPHKHYWLNPHTGRGGDWMVLGYGRSGEAERFVRALNEENSLSLEDAGSLSKYSNDQNLQDSFNLINYERLKMFSVMTVDEDDNNVEVKSVDEIKPHKHYWLNPHTDRDGDWMVLGYGRSGEAERFVRALNGENSLNLEDVANLLKCYSDLV